MKANSPKKNAIHKGIFPILKETKITSKRTERLAKSDNVFNNSRLVQTTTYFKT